QYTRGVLRYDGWNLLGKLLLFVGITTEDNQIGHAGPRHRRTSCRRLRIIPEAGESWFDRGQLDRLRGMGDEDRCTHSILHARPSASMSLSASKGPQVPAAYSGKKRLRLCSQACKISVIQVQETSTASRRMKSVASPASTSSSKRS